MDTLRQREIKVGFVVRVYMPCGDVSGRLVAIDGDYGWVRCGDGSGVGNNYVWPLDGMKLVE